MWCLERLLRDRDGFPLDPYRRTKARSPAACANVLTPDRIPEFCIPPRLEPSLALAALRDSWDRKAEMDQGAGRTDWDPRSQAALSLPHLPRARTAYGFCALLESPHTRRKESLFLGDARATALRRPPEDAPAPRPRTCCGCGGGGDPRQPLPGPGATLAASPASPRAPRNALAPKPRGRRLLRAPHGLLSRALRVRRKRCPVRARSVPGGKDAEERGARSADPAPAPACPSPPPEPRPQLLEAEGTVALGRAGAALRLAAQYWPHSGRLRIRLLRADGPAGGALEPRAVGCSLSLVLQPPAAAPPQRGAVLRPSRKAALDQDFCFDGLTEEQVRRLAVRVKAENKGRGLQRRRALGQGELPLGSLLLL